ncbi:MAG: DUF4040 domain-containing protein [Saprospirales bacterium]|nr:MAG: DUF4040 domain-containing protein [Saprospirales bacterium]
MLTAIIICFGLAFFFFLFNKDFGERILKWSPLLPASLLIYFLSKGNEVRQGALQEFTPWVPEMGINLSFKLDGLSFLFTLLICGIGTLVYFYSVNYMKNHPHFIRFFSFLTLFMGSMLGLVLSDNLITLFIFWELTSISSFFLIGFNHQDKNARKSAITALAITGGGGLLLLVGFVILGIIAGSYELSVLIESGDLIAESIYLPIVILLLFAGAFTKSAQLPFHFWLPDAMRAPTPISTYLHSATMVKAGVYLLARFSPIMDGEFYWNEILIIVGGTTMIYGAVNSIFKTDLKAILAYTTISALGTMMLLIGIGTPAALLALAAFIIVHALYKAGLFLVTGAIDKTEKTRDLLALGGLMKHRKLLFAAGLLAAVSGAGLIPSLGYHGKHLIYESLYNEHSSFLMVILGLVFLANIFIVCASFLAGVKPFTGKIIAEQKPVNPLSMFLLIPPLLLGVGGLIAGVFPAFIEKNVVLPVYQSLSGKSIDPAFHLLHGLDFVSILSWLTIIFGLILYFFFKPSLHYQNTLNHLSKVSSRNLLKELIDLVKKLFSTLTHLLQNGYLRYYTAVILVFLIILIVFRMYTGFGIGFQAVEGTSIRFIEGVTIFMMVVSIVMTLYTDSRVVSVVALGGLGLGMCLLYLFFSAPDLAMTQFAIDTLTVVLFVLLLRNLPLYLNKVDRRLNIKDIMISGIFGAIITLITLEVIAVQSSREISQFYAENAYLLAKGKNIVNVILVDFRGADTLVEIIVLAVAGLGVFSLIKLKMND